MKNGRITISNILLVLASLWALATLVFILAGRSGSLADINTYILIVVTFIAAGQVLTEVIRTKNRGLLLYGALGLACLALGNAYFTVVDLVRDFPPYITVGTFSQVCCYLFFLSMIILLKSERTRGHELLFTVANILAIGATVTCLYSVVANSVPVLRASIIILDGLCIVAALTVLTQKSARFFAVMLILLSSVGLIINTGYIDFGTYYVFVLAIISVLYLVFTRSVLSLKETEAVA